MTEPTPPRAEGLLAAMRRADEGEAGRQDVLDSLPQSVLTVALDGQKILAARTQDGTTVALAFTDAEALTVWSGGASVEWGALEGAELVRHVLEHPGVELVVNVNGPFSGHVLRDELERLAQDLDLPVVTSGDGVERRRIGEDARVGLTAASEPLPAPVAAAVATALGTVESAVAAYALELVSHGQGRPAVGLRLDEGADPAPAAKALQQALAPVLARGDSLDVLPLRAEQAAALAERGIRPVWERES